MRFRKIIASALAAATLALSGCSSDLPDLLLSDLIGGGVSSGTADADTLRFAVENVEYLPVSDKVDNGTYNRAEFGPAWTDKHDAQYGGNGCDTRNDILARDLSSVRYGDNKNCVVVTGVLEEDPYTGRTINFRRGVSTSSAVQIDHIVSLKDAWLSGADNLTYAERVRFANDPINLLASDGPENMSKGAKAADTWLVPENPAYRCAYVAQQVLVKSNYQLSVSESEKRAMVNTLSSCSTASAQS